MVTGSTPITSLSLEVLPLGLGEPVATMVLPWMWMKRFLVHFWSHTVAIPTTRPIKYILDFFLFYELLVKELLIKDEEISSYIVLESIDFHEGLEGKLVINTWC